MTVSEKIQSLAAGEFWTFAAVAAGVALAGMFFGFRYLRRARIVEDTPTARVRSAPQGYVELEGEVEAQEGRPLTAPLTDSACCWYRYQIEKRHDKGWRTVKRGHSDAPFVLRDDTGACIVQPAGAEVTPSDRSVWYGASRVPEDRSPPRVRVSRPAAFGLQLSVGSSGGLFGRRYRYTEERIYPGDRIYAIGEFRSLGELDHQRRRNDMTRQLLGEWKRNPGSLLARFDRDRNGEIDPAEWEQVRNAAARQVQTAHKVELRRRIPHTLADTGSRRRPFLISSLPQFALARRYRWFGAGGLAAFFAGGAVTVLMLTARFGG